MGIVSYKLLSPDWREDEEIHTQTQMFSSSSSRPLKSAAPMPGEEREYVVWFDVWKKLTLLLTVVAVGVVVAILGYIAYGLWHHWTEVYANSLAIIEPQYAARQALLRDYCPQSNFNELEDCNNARVYLQKPMLHRVWEETLKEHYEHLPFYTYCSRNHDCKTILYMLIDGLRSWSGLLGTVLVVGVVYTLFRFLHTTCKNFWYVFNMYSASQDARLPSTVFDLSAAKKHG